MPEKQRIPHYEVVGWNYEMLLQKDYNAYLYNRCRRLEGELGPSPAEDQGVSEPTHQLGDAQYDALRSMAKSESRYACYRLIAMSELPGIFEAFSDVNPEALDIIVAGVEVADLIYDDDRNHFICPQDSQIPKDVLNRKMATLAQQEDGMTAYWPKKLCGLVDEKSRKNINRHKQFKVQRIVTLALIAVAEHYPELLDKEQIEVARELQKQLEGQASSSSARIPNYYEMLGLEVHKETNAEMPNPEQIAEIVSQKQAVSTKSGNNYPPEIYQDAGRVISDPVMETFYDREILNNDNPDIRKHFAQAKPDVLKAMTDATYAAIKIWQQCQLRPSMTNTVDDAMMTAQVAGAIAKPDSEKRACLEDYYHNDQNIIAKHAILNMALVYLYNNPDIQLTEEQNELIRQLTSFHANCDKSYNPNIKSANHYEHLFDLSNIGIKELVALDCKGIAEVVPLQTPEAYLDAFLQKMQAEYADNEQIETMQYNLGVYCHLQQNYRDHQSAHEALTARRLRKVYNAGLDSFDKETRDGMRHMSSQELTAILYIMSRASFCTKNIPANYTADYVDKQGDVREGSEALKHFWKNSTTDERRRFVTAAYRKHKQMQSVNAEGQSAPVPALTVTNVLFLVFSAVRFLVENVIIGSIKYLALYVASMITGNQQIKEDLDRGDNNAIEIPNAEIGHYAELDMQQHNAELATEEEQYEGAGSSLDNEEVVVPPGTTPHQDEKPILNSDIKPGETLDNTTHAVPHPTDDKSITGRQSK